MASSPRKRAYPTNHGFRRFAFRTETNAVSVFVKNARIPTNQPFRTVPLLAGRAATLGYFTFDGVVDQTTQATSHKHSEQMLGEFWGPEKYHLAVRIDET